MRISGLILSLDRPRAGSTTCSSPASHSHCGAHLSVRKHGAALRGAGTTCLRATARWSPAGRLGAYLSHLRTETWRLPAQSPAHRAPSARTGPRLPLFRTKTWRRPTRGGRLLAKVLPPPSRRLRSGHTGRYPPEPGSEDRPQRGEGCSLGRAEAEASRARRASFRASAAAPAAVSFPARAAGGRTPRQVREGDAEAGSPAGPAREAPGGIPRHFLAPSAPVGSRAVWWRRGGSRGGGGGRRRAAFVPPLEAVLLARPSSITRSRPATPSPARTVVYNGIRAPRVSGTGGQRERVPASVDGAPCLCRETLSAGECLVAPWAERVARMEGLSGQCEEPLTPVPFSGGAGVGDC